MYWAYSYDSPNDPLPRVKDPWPCLFMILIFKNYKEHIFQNEQPHFPDPFLIMNKLIRVKHARQQEANSYFEIAIFELSKVNLEQLRKCPNFVGLFINKSQVQC